MQDSFVLGKVSCDNAQIALGQQPETATVETPGSCKNNEMGRKIIDVDVAGCVSTTWHLSLPQETFHI